MEIPTRSCTRQMKARSDGRCSPPHPKTTPSPSSRLKAYHQLVNESCLSDTTFSDIVLLVDGERFQCHRVILAAASAPLRAMFVSPMKESQSSEIELKGIEGGASTFRAMIKYIYTGVLDLPETTVSKMTGKDGAKTPTGDDDEQSTGVDEIILNLVQVASMYEILPLQEECENHLIKLIDRDSCFYLLEIGELYSLTRLYEKCYEIIASNFVSLLGLEDSPEENICSLGPKTIRRLLEDDNLDDQRYYIRERLILRITVKWCSLNEKNQAYLADLLSLVRFPFMSVERLQTLKKSYSPYLDEHRPLIDELLLEAYHFKVSGNSHNMRTTARQAYQDFCYCDSHKFRASYCEYCGENEIAGCCCTRKSVLLHKSTKPHCRNCGGRRITSNY